MHHLDIVSALRSSLLKWWKSLCGNTPGGAEMQQIHIISNNISVPACGAHEKIEQSASDQMLKGELSTSMGSVGKAPVTNTRAERKKEPH